MPRISYSITDGRGEWTEVSKEAEDVLIIRLYPPMNGYLNVDKAVYRVKSGEVRIPLSELGDKEYSPRIECDGKGIALEKFSKCGKDISPAPTDENTIRALLGECRKNEERLRTVENTLSVLMKRTEGHRIFN